MLGGPKRFRLSRHSNFIYKVYCVVCIQWVHIEELQARMLEPVCHVRYVEWFCRVRYRCERFGYHCSFSRKERITRICSRAYPEQFDSLSRNLGEYQVALQRPLRVSATCRHARGPWVPRVRICVLAREGPHLWSTKISVWMPI